MGRESTNNDFRQGGWQENRPGRGGILRGGRGQKRVVYIDRARKHVNMVLTGWISQI